MDRWGRPNAAPGGAAEPPRTKLTVLFVDPDLAGIEPLVRALRRRYAVAVVPSAQAAHAALSQRTPDLVVTELDLPDTGGLGLIASIHGAPATRNVLLMVLTGRHSVNDKIAAFQAGADDYLVKPVDAEQFETHLLLVSKFRKIIRN
jgi:DNA-binding response OmpR family regulator